MDAMKRFCAQSFRLPEPTVTEKNAEDQSGRVFIVTGGYAGVGLELSKLLYTLNATVYVAGRSQGKAETAMSTIRAAHAESRGRLDFIPIDLADRNSIKPGLKDFLARESRLDVLVLNAGVMIPPKGSVDAHGDESQLGTNALGHFLLYRLLQPLLERTAALPESKPASTRVLWAGSLGVDVMSPKPGGMKLDAVGKPLDLGVEVNYGQSKVANLFYARHESKHTPQSGIVHLAFNPGNLRTELQRHASGVQMFATGWMLHPAVFGAYTELWSALAPDVKPTDSGKYVWPWGRFGLYRKDIEDSMNPEGSSGGTGLAVKFVSWSQEQIKPYL